MTESSIRYRGWRVVIGCFTMTFFGFGSVCRMSAIPPIAEVQARSGHVRLVP
jgi:hypothetical protein